MKIIQKLLDLKNLTQKEAYELFTEFPEYSSEKKSAISALLRSKTETTEEILGALQYFIQYSKYIEHDFEIIDLVGTGGDGLGTFNISTAASFVVASCGALVAKHGGRSSTSQAGSQDVMQALGIKTPQTAEEALKLLHKSSYTRANAS